MRALLSSVALGLMSASAFVVTAGEARAVPTLRIALDSGRVFVSFEAASGWRLQRSADLRAWTDYAQGPRGFFRLDVGCGGAGFFRLAQERDEDCVEGRHKKHKKKKH